MFMPSQESHREQAESNEKAANSIKNTFPDWAVTMCFYAAIHWVERYAKINNVDLTKYEISSPDTSKDKKVSLHTRRFHYVKDIAYDSGNPDLRKAYETLEKASKTARSLEAIQTNSWLHYSNNSTYVAFSFRHLEIVKKATKELT